DFGVDVEAADEVLRDARRRIKVVELQPHAGDAVQAIELFRVLELDQRKAAVELVHPDLEHADHGEAFQARQRSGRRQRALRRDDDDGFTKTYAESAREIRAEYDAEAT